MDLFEAIRTRRSIRSFTDEPVSQEDMDRMLEAAMCAPSANNRQLWHFVVIRDREMLRKVAEVHPTPRWRQAQPQPSSSAPI